MPFLYQGQYVDAETGLAYNRFRYYDNEAGNYISQDPIGLLSGEDNLYAYVCNSNCAVDIFGLNPIGEINEELAKLARQVHDLSRDEIAKTRSTVSIAEVEVNGKSTLYAARSGEKNFTPEQIQKLKDLGIPEENIITVPRRKPNPRIKGDNLANHAERIIERNLPEGAEVKKWGISWAAKQKNEMCSNCKTHFNHH